jgi:Ni/Co efflux regulator RcnB
MRRLLTLSLIAASLVPALAMAQTSRGELQRDRQDIRDERRDLERAKANGTRGDVRDAREDYREARQEYREDRRDYNRNEWRSYRQSNRNLYGRGSYRSAYRYTAFRPGIRIASGYYAPRHLIADPWRYRLPRVSGYNRWVRHHDDVLLINTRTGYVVDVIRGFYW